MAPMVYRIGGMISPKLLKLVGRRKLLGYIPCTASRGFAEALAYFMSPVSLERA